MTVTSGPGRALRARPRAQAALLALATAALLVLPAVASADVAPFGHACTAQNGVRFCPGGFAAPSPTDPAGFDRRVKTFDGVPLDVDVTLPLDTAGPGPYPTIVFLHGYGGSKKDYEQSDPNTVGANGQAILYHWNNTYYAQRGYAVVNYTARGFGDSCGSQASRTADCLSGAKGYIHLKDRSFEARDTQYLLGLLVDQGIAKAGALGVTGISYGGGESIELALLHDKMSVRNPGSPAAAPPATLVPWTSPTGVPLAIDAAYPRWPWSDLVSSLVPNGRFLDFDTRTDGSSRSPIGIPIQTYIEGLYASGLASGLYAPAGSDMTADLTNWNNRISAGDPYKDAYAQHIVDEIAGNHQGFGEPNVSPLLIENGWTDDLFPPAEALRVYNDLRSRDPNADVALQFGDLGHARGQNKANTNKRFNDQGSAFMDAHLKGGSSVAPPAKGSVTAFTQTCPADAPGGAPFTAASWPAIHPGAFTFTGDPTQTVTSAGGNPSTGKTIDPIAGGGACATVADETATGTAVYRGPKVTTAFTLVGLPTVQATIAETGIGGQLDSRLWDVAPGGQQTLVSRGAYRLDDNQTGTIRFQLHGNGYRFEPGHVPKLELLGNDAPYLQANKGQFSVAVAKTVVELPVLEQPGGQIVRPVLGRGGTVRRATPRLKLRGPARVRQNRRTRLRFLVTTFVGGRNRAVAGVTIRIAHHKVRTNARGRASMVLRFRSAGHRRVRADRRGYRGARRTVTVLRAKHARRHHRRARHRAH